ncbi:MAG: methionyl-tRNA formyltransferase, partial [Actinobacteria bacterium]|nr:methionyl-tRNA formyltransferase [Actinomycetota bacterium]
KPTIERLSTEHDVALLISTPDAPSGRGRTLAPNEFATYFASDIRLAKPETQDDLSRLLSEKKIDIAIAIAYGKLIKKSALETPSYGWINLHFSLLPKWRGAAPVQRAIMANEQEIGLTIFKLDEGMDTGPMFRQMTYQISRIVHLVMFSRI